MGKKETLTLNEFLSGTKIEDDIKTIAKTFSKNLAEQAEKDLLLAHKMIVDNFYSKNMNFASRRKRDLYDTVAKHSTRKYGNSFVYIAQLTLDSSAMYDNRGGARKKVSGDSVFDLIWNQGVRGLPERGSSPLDKDFTWLGHSFHKGENWVNPYWSGEAGPYYNIFNTSVKLGGYSTLTGTPDQVFTDFTNHWDKASGETACEKIEKLL